MPANTPYSNLPYPLGGDPVADGDDAVKNLAEALDASWAFLNATYVTQASPDLTVAPWDAIGAGSAATPEFTIGNGTHTNSKLTYTGPSRFFTFALGWDNALWYMQMLVNGVIPPFGESNSHTVDSGTTQVNGLLTLSSGDFIEFKIIPFLFDNFVGTTLHPAFMLHRMV